MRRHVAVTMAIFPIRNIMLVMWLFNVRCQLYHKALKKPRFFRISNLKYHKLAYTLEYIYNTYLQYLCYICIDYFCVAC